MILTVGHPDFGADEDDARAFMDAFLERVESPLISAFADQAGVHIFFSYKDGKPVAERLTAATIAATSLTVLAWKEQEEQDVDAYDFAVVRDVLEPLLSRRAGERELS